MLCSIFVRRLTRRIVSGQVAALRGYWTAGSPSNLYYKCPQVAMCPGGNTTTKATCAVRALPLLVSRSQRPASHPLPHHGGAQAGHTGPLCFICESGYFKVATDCVPCGNSGDSGARVALSVLFFVFLVGVFLYSSIGHSKRYMTLSDDEATLYKGEMLKRVKLMLGYSPY